MTRNSPRPEKNHQPLAGPHDAAAGTGRNSGSDQDPAPELHGEDVPFRKFLLYFLRLGTTGFGGPIATVGYSDLVEQRGWIERQEFLDGVALGQAMPGPLAAQVAMWIGYLRRGSWGALAIAAAFIGPSFAMVLAAGALYAAYSGTGIVQALFYGIAPAVMAIILIAAYKLLKLTDRRDWRLWAISAVVFTVTALTGSEPIPLILGAGLVILFLDAPPRWRRPGPRKPRIPKPPAAGAKALFLPAVFAVPAATTATGAATLLPLGLFFLQTGALVFGSGLAIVPLLRDGVVGQHHWLDQAQFLDAVAMGLITPGPVVITAGFIGYLTAGLPGAVVATVGIFTPIYLAVVLLGRWFVRHRENKRVKAFVAGATAAAAGALAGAVVVLTRQAVTDWITAAIGVVTFGLLWRFKIGEPWIVLAAGVIGLVLKLVLHVA